jgi:cytochrome c biogenesis factor
MQLVPKLLVVNDLAIFALLILLVIGFLSYDYDLFGMNESIIPISKEYKFYFELIPWFLFLLLSIDLLIKYLYVGKDLRYFLKKYWIDILLTILIPVLFPLKFIKPSVKIYKSTKFVKSGYKIYQKYDKIFKLKK